MASNRMRRISAAAVAVCLCVAILSSCSQHKRRNHAMKAAAPATPAETEFVTLCDGYEARFRPLFMESARAWWEASTTGSDAAFEAKKAAENKLVELHSDKATFAKIKGLKDGGKVKDPVMARELDVMYRAFLPGQADPELQKRIIVIQNECEQIFNTHRGAVKGKEVTENDIRKILGETRDSAEAKEAWTAYIEVGRKIEPKLREVARLRNELARKLGYANFFVMQLALQEINDKELIELFDDLDRLTHSAFAKVKGEIDAARASKFGVAADQLKPWHFGDLFFQEAPQSEGANLDSIYKDADLLALTRDYYQSLDMPVEAILTRSDMYEKKGKSPHAFCTNIDRDQDIRVLCNVKQNLYWADTVIHEVGHAVYEQYIHNDVPFLLHEPSHPITTEGMAMMFGAFVKSEDFLNRVRKLPADQRSLAAAARKSKMAERLIFSRWTQVMVRFEQGMYSNPDQDLAKLWWDLKKKYQMLNPPDDMSLPGYAAKVHVVGAPVYYHSYMLGDLFACQVQEYMAKNILKMDDASATCFYGSKEAGRYMKDEVFGPGNLYSWNDLTKRCTGEELNPRAFAKQCGM